jgi:hypothetical protein
VTVPAADQAGESPDAGTFVAAVGDPSFTGAAGAAGATGASGALRERLGDVLDARVEESRRGRRTTTAPRSERVRERSVWASSPSDAPRPTSAVFAMAAAFSHRDRNPSCAGGPEAQMRNAASAEASCPGASSA